MCKVHILVDGVVCIMHVSFHTTREARLCPTKNEPPIPPIPELTIRSQSGGVTTTEPRLFPNTVRSLKVEIGPAGDLVRVTAELLPSSLLLMLKNPAVTFMMDGQAVAEITLADGTVIRFD